MNGVGRARARANIALAKYWGKSDVGLNLPAVPSISMTLDRLVTETTVRFDDKLARDRVRLDGATATGSAERRVVQLMDRVRERAGISTYAQIESANAFPTAAGLASSASGFAALSAAAVTAAGLPYRDKDVSRLARLSSASAARSVYGGFVELRAGRKGEARLSARPLFGPEHWDVRLVIALTAVGPKDVGSTAGMERSKTTSPFYDAWVEAAPAMCSKVRRALGRRDLRALGRAMEQSTMSFHASALACDPAILYWEPATLAALRTVRRLRSRGLSAYATMDAGPHVKVLCHAEDVTKVQRALRQTEGVLRTLVNRPGPGVELLEC